MALRVAGSGSPSGLVAVAGLATSMRRSPSSATPVTSDPWPSIEQDTVTWYRAGSRRHGSSTGTSNRPSGPTLPVYRRLVRCDSSTLTADALPRSAAPQLPETSTVVPATAEVGTTSKPGCPQEAPAAVRRRLRDASGPDRFWAGSWDGRSAASPRTGCVRCDPPIEVFRSAAPPAPRPTRRRGRSRPRRGSPPGAGWPGGRSWRRRSARRAAVRPRRPAT